MEGKGELFFGPEGLTSTYKGYPISEAVMERFKGEMIFVPVRTEKKNKEVSEK